MLEAPLRGHTLPRLSTPPLAAGPPGPCPESSCGCSLSPSTSYGFDVIAFARDVLGEPLDPWQAWLVVHAGEMLPDGRPRFRHILVLVARQNGKTHLLKVLALYWLFVEQWPLVLGTSSNLEYAKESWSKAVETAEDTPELAALLPKNAVLKGNNDIHLKTVDRCKYKIGTAGRKGGRSLSIDRLIQDELREHPNWLAWDAATKAMNARPAAQNWCLSNMGDDKSVVLDAHRESCLSYLQTGAGDERFGIFEWSAPEGAGLLDEQAWAAANPNLGHRIDVDTIRGDALRAAQSGGEQESGFRTEVLCQRVKSLDAAIDPTAWNEGTVPGDLFADDVRARLVAFVDLSPDRMHATLTAAAVMPDDRVRVTIVKAWSGHDAAAQLRRDLPGWVAKVRPRQLGWIPGGPAAAVAADLKARKGRQVWPPRGVTVSEVTAEVPAVCMGFAEQVGSGAVVHADEPLLTAQVTGAGKLWTGDVWRFNRKGEGHCDAAYAAAGAVHLARTMPASTGKPRLIVARATA